MAIRKKKKISSSVIAPAISLENEHSFVTSIANELFRMNQNLNNMDDGIKGVTNLKNRVESILTIFKTRGYDIPVLLGETYHEGFNMIATMEFDENLERGIKVIKRIIKPQVNYNGIMIQAAEVVVAYNE